MSLRAIVQALGGELYAGGRRALVPAPGHSPSDRSVSLLLSEGRVVVHSFGGAGWAEVLDALRAQGLIDAQGAPVEIGARPLAADLRSSEPARIAHARSLWESGGPLRGPARCYCRRRHVTGDLAALSALRAHPALALAAYRGRGPRRPALLAAAHDPAGALTAVEITYLDAAGRRDVRLAISRKVIGCLPAGSAVRLAPSGARLLVAEGVFTTLSAMARFRLPGWALLSANNLSRWTPPSSVRQVLIAADRDRVGLAAARALARRLAEAGVASAIRPPPAPFGDWNDWAAAQEEEEGREGAPGAQGRALTPRSENLDD